MIISPNRRFAFIHLHKCAGTSMERALEPYLQHNDLVLGSTVSGEKLQPLFRQLLSLTKHSPAAKAQKVLGEDLWRSWYTFSFVRHPVDRLRSLYSYKKTLISKRPMNDREAATFKAKGVLPHRPPYKYPGTRAALVAEDFNAFVLHPATWKDTGAQPMWQSLCDEDGKLLVSFVGKLEQLEQDWAQIEAVLQVNAPVGHHNASASDKVPTALNLSDEAWAMLEKHYARDCELFGYTLREPVRR